MMRDERIENAIFFADFVDDVMPWIEPEKIHAFNSIVGAKLSGTFSCAEQTISLVYIPNIPSDYDLQARVSLSSADQLLRIYFHPSLLEQLYAGRVSFNNSDRPLYDLMASHTIGKFLDRYVEGLVGTNSISLCIGQHYMHSPAFAFQFMVGSQKDPYYIILEGDPHFIWNLLENNNVKYEQPQSSIRIPHKVTIVSDGINLSKGELCRLTQGDLLHIPSAGCPDHRFNFVVGDLALASVSFRNGQVEILNIFQKIEKFERFLKKEGQSMDQQKISSEMESSEVELSIEVGKRLMTQKELSNLTEGMLLDFGKIDKDSAKLSINGEIVAHATIIEVGDGMGLRIGKVI